MKRIGILSDTHSYWDDKYLSYFKDCDEIWHAGDIGDVNIARMLNALAPLRAVSGNIDHGEVRRKFPEQQIFEVEGVKILLTHIGGYLGKYNYGIRETLIKEHIKLFVCGHSHILKVIADKKLNLLHINPGAAGNQGWQTVRTLIRLVLDEGNIRDLEVIELSGR